MSDPISNINLISMELPVELQKQVDTNSASS
jgi:hypothetical protein